MKIIFLTLIFFIDLASEKSDSIKGFLHPKKLRYRDSLQIFSTINQWKQQNYKNWGAKSHMYILKDEEVVFYTSRVFYSPDSLKLIVWFNKILPNPIYKDFYENEGIIKKEVDSSIDTVYMALSVICYRDSINHMWKIFSSTRTSGYCAIKDSSCYQYFEKFYFEEFKNQVRAIEFSKLDTNFGKVLGQKYVQILSEEEYINVSYGYNFNDEEFWDKCLIWKKGLFFENRYIFEPVSELQESFMPIPRFNC